MSLKIFSLTLVLLFTRPLQGQEIILQVLGPGDPVNGVLAYSHDRSRFAISDREGKMNWKLVAFPDTIHISHLSFLDHTEIIQSAAPAGGTLLIRLQPRTINLATAEIATTWVKPNTHVVQSTLNESQIASRFLVQDIPYIIQQFPSTVTTSDAGNGIGYTNVRIRGLDPTQVNVMVNGVPLNDAESQAVFWVDLPDLIASASALQVQRGIGTSGAGQVAFGSSLLLSTYKTSPVPYAQLESSVGSFATLKNSLQLNSGTLGKAWNFSGRLSRIRSDGYVDRAASSLWSGAFNASYIGTGRSVRFFIFDGFERTYQAWYGLPVQYVGDKEKRTYNPAGTEKPGLPYEDQIDRYRQTHFQLIHQEDQGKRWAFQNTFHFTPGRGFYEEYKSGQSPSDYLLDSGDELDIVRRRNLENHFLGSIHTARFRMGDYEINGGLAWNLYSGRHFGQVIQAGNKPLPDQPVYYDNEATKWSAMTFGKMTWDLHPWSLMADLQYRRIGYSYQPAYDPEQGIKTVHHHFLNPKLGFTLAVGPHAQLFGFSGIARREPNRDDYVDADRTLPRAERLWDHEAGFRWGRRNLQIEQNIYYMLYKDQLIPTGRLNDVGAYIRSNVEKSYRLGSETSVAWNPGKLNVQASLTLSRNRTLNYQAYFDDWDSGTQEKVNYGSQPIAFSPSFIGNLSSEYLFYDKQAGQTRHFLFLDGSVQAVGRQFLDGTGDPSALLPAYRHAQLALRYRLIGDKIPSMDFHLQVNNLFNSRYESNGWIYRFRSPSYNPVPDDPYAGGEGDHRYYLKGLYPQAGRHFMLSCRIRLEGKGG